MPDINLTCCDCKNPFYWTEKDQAFYKSRNFQQPKRCWSCRQKRKTNGSQDHQSAQQQPAPAQPPQRGRHYYQDEDDRD